MNSSGLSQEMLDDFFAEADEHLQSVRHAILQLENSGSEAIIQSKIVGELFHHFHSFKEFLQLPAWNLPKHWLMLQKIYFV